MPRLKRSTELGILTAALAGLEVQRQHLEEQIARVQALLGKRKGQAPGRAPARRRARRRLSAAARKRISEAQKRRWEEHHERRAAA